MDDTLRVKLDEARERMNSQQAGINTNRKHDDPAMREWARGKQRPANAERAQFRASLTDEDRGQIEERIEQLVHDNPTLSSTNARTVGSKTEQPSVSGSVCGPVGATRVPRSWIRTTDSETVAFSLSDLSARFLTARNCMSLILKMKTSTESGLWVD
jgi:hypothetical protein